MSDEEKLQLALRKYGYCLTAQRRAILEILLVERELLTADDIFHKARQTNPHLNLATVYRTLTILRKAGLVDQSYASPDPCSQKFHPEAGFN